MDDARTLLTRIPATAMRRDWGEISRQIPAALTRPFSSYLNLMSRNPARHEDPKAP